MTYKELIEKCGLDSDHLIEQTGLPKYSLNDMLVELGIKEKLLVRFETNEQRLEFIERCRKNNRKLEIVKIGPPSEWYYADTYDFNPVCYYLTQEQLKLT